MGISNGINFSDYLIKNEKWLATPGEKPGEHETDGKLSNDEVSAFFSKSHIDLNNEATIFDRKISQKDFNDWYKANEDAISAYYEEIGLGSDAYSNEDYRDAMRDSMLNFVDNDYKNMFSESSFDELKAEQLGLVDKAGVLEENVYLGMGTGVKPIYTDVDFETLNRDEIFAYDPSLLAKYETELHNMVKKGNENDQINANNFKKNIINLFKSQISIAV